MDLFRQKLFQVFKLLFDQWGEKSPHIKKIIMDIIFNKTNFDINESVEGKSVEEKMRETTMNGQPIDNAAPLIYTDKKEGVLPQYDIRTDRWDIALETTDKIARTNVAKSQTKPENNPNLAQPEA